MTYARRDSTPARPDPRPTRRVRLSSGVYARRARAFVERARFCECGCGRRAHSVHHLIGGTGREDLPQNWVALNGDGTRGCHGAYTSKQRVWDPVCEVYIDPHEVAVGIRRRLDMVRLDAKAYILERKGEAWLDARYPAA